MGYTLSRIWSWLRNQIVGYYKWKKGNNMNILKLQKWFIWLLFFNNLRKRTSHNFSRTFALVNSAIFWHCGLRWFIVNQSGAYLRLNSVHVIIPETGGGLGFFLDEMENGVIWGHFGVSYNIESSTILMTLINKNFLKLSKICPSCFIRYEHLHCFVQVHFKISVNICINPKEDSLKFIMVDLT